MFEALSQDEKLFCLFFAKIEILIIFFIVMFKNLEFFNKIF